MKGLKENAIAENFRINLGGFTVFFTEKIKKNICTKASPVQFEYHNKASAGE